MKAAPAFDAIDPDLEELKMMLWWGGAPMGVALDGG